MNYAEMSDFEINVMVFETLHGGSPDCREGVFGGMILVSEEHEIVGGRDTAIVVYRGLFSPCNSWADAGPIIHKYGIGLKKQSNGLWVGTQVGGKYPKYSESPLRAEMIVFLMMQEGK